MAEFADKQFFVHFCGIFYTFPLKIPITTHRGQFVNNSESAVI
jgi:hypothetical protein